MLLQLKDIKPNPFRDLKRNPLIQGVIDELVSSINDTGFWDNVLVRKNAQGDYELAYGHTRVAAALEAGLTEANFIVRKLDDGMMLKVMDRENRKMYDNSVPALLESVRAVVRALAEGLIPAFEINPKTNKSAIMNAPSFTPGVSVADSATHPYTASSIAFYLGRTKGSSKDKADQPGDDVQAALIALHLMEHDVLKESEIRGMPVVKLLDLVRGLKKKLDDNKERMAKDKAEAETLRQQRLVLETTRKEQERKDKLAKEEYAKAMATAKLEKDKEEMAELEAERVRNAQRAQERYAKIKENRKLIDDKIEDNRQRAEAYKPKPEVEIRVQGVSALRIKFDNVYSDSHGLTQEAVAMGRNQNLTPEERETLRQAMLKAGERLRYGAEIFLPPGVARMATKALREKAAKKTADNFFKSKKGDKK